MESTKHSLCDVGSMYRALERGISLAPKTSPKLKDCATDSDDVSAAVDNKCEKMQWLGRALRKTERGN
eukprot:COSAG05_NODE_22672_length_263_cov_0.628049_1_plen_67_part_10